MKSNFTFKAYSEFDNELIAIWKEIENNANILFFQRLLYIQNLIKIFDVKNYLIIVIHNNNIPVAILPLELKIIKTIKILQWLGSNESDYCCPIILKEDIFIQEEFSNIWKKILKKINNFDIIYLNKQPENILETPNPFVKFLKNSYHSQVFQIQLHENEADYLTTLKNKKFISEFSRTRKKLLEKNNIKFENLSKNADIFISDIIKKKIYLLKERKISHSLDDNFIAFYKNLKMMYPDKLILSTLSINDEVIAANIGIIDNKRFSYLLPVVFSEKFKSFSPGKLLIYELINWSKKNNLKAFDFGIGEELYKKYWSNHSMKIFRYLSFEGFKGSIIYFFLNIYLRLKKNI